MPPIDGGKTRRQFSVYHGRVDAHWPTAAGLATHRHWQELKPSPKPTTPSDNKIILERLEEMP